ncbi:hypothetical protein RRG08_037916 [Elysia crispata]|uniref:Uncharacterized protein n=1 Tax=Elysia crispata TaxID=231223 RepID=A0AAE1B9C9_9GAST|nr:hypothetical protein RRG08_037916 [Elysia crispata]
MAASMTEGVLAVKEKWIEELENHFHEKLRSFTSDVKMKMRSVSKEAAIQVFEFAVLFLTQTFPDLGGFESASDVIKDGTMELRKDFDKLERTLSQKLKEAQQSLAEKLEDAQQTLSEKFDAQQSLCEKLENAQRSLSEKTDAQQTFCEKLDYDQRSFFEKLEDAQQNLSEKFSEVQEKASSFQHKVENDLDKLNEANESNTHQILGLRKLQKLLSDKTKISQTTAVKTPSTTKASASAAATPCGPPKSLSQRSTFSARAPDDTKVLNIWDTKLLPGGLVVLSDNSNECVKLYDWQGGFNLIASGILFEFLSSNVRCGECDHYSVTTAFKNSSKYGFCHEIELKYQNCSVWSTGFKTSRASSKSGHSEINLTMVKYVPSLGCSFSALQHFSLYVTSPPPVT